MSETRIQLVDKKISYNNWRETNSYISDIQKFKEASTAYQSQAMVTVTGSDPIAVLCLSDLHIGALGVDHGLLEAITDTILQTPDLYVVLLGDICEMAIRLRGVSEVLGQILTPGEQTQYVKSWLEEIAPRVLCATWGNHDAIRQEELTGYSDLAELFAGKVIYHNGMGHLDLNVGEQTYKLAVTHKYRGHSLYNPAQGAVRYLMSDAPEREVALCGDSHRPGVCMFTHGETVKLAVTSGTLNIDNVYGKRFFSLYTHSNFPVVLFRGDKHEFVPFWSLGQYLRTRGIDQEGV
jgi:hypothetical protein